MMATLKLSALQELEAQARLNASIQTRTIEREKQERVVIVEKPKKPKVIKQNYFLYNLINHGGKDGVI